MRGQKKEETGESGRPAHEGGPREAGREGSGEEALDGEGGGVAG